HALHPPLTGVGGGPPGAAPPTGRIHSGQISLRKPESTAKSAPLVLAERGEASSATTSAISCGSARRPVVSAIICGAPSFSTVSRSVPDRSARTSAAPPSSVHHAVRTGPGDTVFT